MLCLAPNWPFALVPDSSGSEWQCKALVSLLVVAKCLCTLEAENRLLFSLASAGRAIIIWEWWQHFLKSVLGSWACVLYFESSGKTQSAPWISPLYHNNWYFSGQAAIKHLESQLLAGLIHHPQKADSLGVRAMHMLATAPGSRAPIAAPLWKRCDSWFSCPARDGKLLTETAPVLLSKVLSGLLAANTGV